MTQNADDTPGVQDRQESKSPCKASTSVGDRACPDRTKARPLTPLPIIPLISTNERSSLQAEHVISRDDVVVDVRLDITTRVCNPTSIAGPTTPPAHENA